MEQDKNQKLFMCCWCDREFYPNQLSESRFLGGLVCPDCDADEGSKTLGEIQAKVKSRSAESVRNGIGWVK